MRFPGLGEPPTFPRVRLARPSLWPANSGISPLDWWLCGASLRLPFSNCRFGKLETGSICDGDRFAASISRHFALLLEAGGLQWRSCAMCFPHNGSAGSARSAGLRKGPPKPRLFDCSTRRDGHGHLRRRFRRDRPAETTQERKRGGNRRRP